MDIREHIDPRIVSAFADGRLTDAWRHFGCHPVPGAHAHRFLVWAPGAKSVSLVGDFNGWDAGKNPMTPLGGAWGTVAGGLSDGSIYKYAVLGADGVMRLKADPFAFHSETGPATGSKVWDTGGFEWTDGDFVRPEGYEKAPVSIYEMHIGSWKRDESAVYPWYRSTADELAEYCTEMGYTHVELLPVTEYPYEDSWGYQVTGYFAPTSRYGTPQDFMYFVDRLHRSGIGVIIDWVPAHFPRDEHGLARFDGTPLYERKSEAMASHPEWGTLIFDYSSGCVQSLLLSSADMFFEKYHVDGLRVDAVTSMLYLGYARRSFERNSLGGDTDLGAVSLLRRVNSLAAGLGRMTVAEESSAYPGVTAPERDGGLGFTFKWDMGFMHDTLDYFSLDPIYRRGSHGKLTFSMMYAFSERYILAFSHDEAVHGKKSMLGKMPGSYDEKFSNLRALYGYVFAHPGKKLLFMGGEFGQFIEWNYKRELDWFLLEYPRHREMQRYCRALNKFYLAHPALYLRDTGWDGFHWLNVDDCDRSSIAFLRTDGAETIVCCFNFTPVQWEMRIALPASGTLFPLLSSDDFRFGGSGTVLPEKIGSEAVPFLDMAHSAMVTLPPLSAVYYEFKEDENGRDDKASSDGKESHRAAEGLAVRG